MAEYTRPYLYPKQRDAIFTNKRWALTEASAQPLTTRIPTPIGWREFGSLSVGDFVFGPDGQAAPIAAIIPHGKRQVYKLTFVDGTSTRACADHIWRVSDGKHERNITTGSLLDCDEDRLQDFTFPICDPVEFVHRPVPIDPWLLGVLIGDGNICNNVIGFSSADPEIVSRVSGVVPQGYEVGKSTGAEYSYIIRPKFRGAGYEEPNIRMKAGAYEVAFGTKYLGRTKSLVEAEEIYQQGLIDKFGRENVPETNLRRELRTLGLLGKKHNQKFIPEIYLNNSPDIRAEILRGVMDTDGSPGAGYSAIIEQTSIHLFMDIEQIVRSLGGFAHTRVMPLRNDWWKHSYTTSIRLPRTSSAFWLERKKSKQKDVKKPLARRLESITEVGLEEVQCIAVDHPTSLYLVDDFVVTHNTKSGKTVASITRFIEWGLFGNGLEPAAPGQNYWWVAPVSDQARIAFNRVKQNLTPGSFTARESPIPSISLMTGPTLSFKSGDNPDSLYGEDVFGGVIDEASRCRPDSWFAMRSTLTATRGPCVIIGNVKGKKNWFYEWCRKAERGLDPNAQFSRITWRDAVEAKVLDLEEIEDARRNLPEMVFQELYEALASDDSGNPFGEDHIYACLLSNEDGTISSSPASGKPVAYGIDLAKKADYLVVIGLDQFGRVCDFHRWHGVPWGESIDEIHSIVGEDVPALVDSTGVGDPVLESLQDGYGNFRGYNFSSVSKQKLMEGLAVSIQSHAIQYPDGPIKNELLSFEYQQVPSGIRYAAAAGYNDDCVCSLALAREQWTTLQPAAAMMEFYQGQHKIAIERLKTESQTVTKTTRRSLGLDVNRPTEEQVHNELTDLYTEILASYQTPSSVCFRCAEPVTGPTRVTDGAHIWHQECY